VFRESDAVTRSMRDYLSDDVGECWWTASRLPEGPRSTCSAHAGEAQRRLKLYTDDIPLFYALPDRKPDRVPPTPQGATAFGGSIVIDYTRSAGVDRHQLRARTRAGSIETTATTPICEPRTRSPGSCASGPSAASSHRLHRHGVPQETQRDVEDRLRDAMKMDRARIQIGRLSTLRLARDGRGGACGPRSGVQSHRLPGCRRHRQHPQPSSR